MTPDERLELARQRVRNAIRLPRHGAGPSEYDALFEAHPAVADDLAADSADEPSEADE
jgi:hypothetical protein